MFNIGDEVEVFGYGVGRDGKVFKIEAMSNTAAFGYTSDGTYVAMHLKNLRHIDNYDNMEFDV